MRGPTAVPATSTVSSPDLDPHRHELCELVGERVLELDQLDPALRRHRGGIDEIDGLLGVTREDPDEDRDPEQPGVVLGERPAELGLDLVDRPVPEPLGEAAELLAQRHERGQSLHHLGPHGLDVHRVRHHASGQRRAHLLRGDHSRPVLSLLGRRSGA